ncbi:hypothetical protein ACTFIY_004565 [Dictyostelium cf. discoideum]
MEFFETVHNKLSSVPQLDNTQYRVFAEDITNNGAKRFIQISHGPDMFGTLMSRPIGKRHFHEVINNGPVHLYLDLDCKISDYHWVDFNVIVRDIIFLIIDFMRLCFPDEYIYEDSTYPCDGWVVLESKNPEKFSRHIIWRMPGLCWRSNTDLGNFIKEFVYFVSTKSWFLADFIDTGVYSKNKCFRTFMSSKKGGVLGSELVLDKNFYQQNESKKLNYYHDDDIFDFSLIRVIEEKFRKELTFGEYRFINQSFNPTCLFKSDIQEILNYFGVKDYCVRGSRAFICVSKFCPFEMRYHKSNSNYLVYCGFTRSFTMKCHDPDCKTKTTAIWGIDRIKNIEDPSDDPMGKLLGLTKKPLTEKEGAMIILNLKNNN